MQYLLIQIFFCLLVAFLIGLLIGWWIWRNRCRSRIDDLQAELERNRKALADCMASRGTGARVVAATGTAATAAAGAGAGATPVMAAAAIPAKSSRDDLKKIWGIGKKMEEILNGAGIETFAAVSRTPVERLREIVASYGSKRLTDIANEETWPEQAEMAARGDWEALKAYQSELTWRSGGKPSKD